MRKVFEPEREEITGDWRKLHSEELNGLLFSPNIVLGSEVKENVMSRRCDL